MVAAESDPEEDDLGMRPKKKSKTNSLPGDDLDEEEAAFKAAIAPAADVYDNSFDMENDNGDVSEEDKSSHGTENAEENVEGDEMAYGEEEPLGVFGGGVDNGVSSDNFFFFVLVILLLAVNLNCCLQIEVQEEEDIKPFVTKRMKTPSKTRGSSNKVKEDDFSPHTRRLAIASKNYICELTALKSPFPLDNENHREEYIWAMIQKTAQTKEIYQDAFKDAQIDSELQLSMVAFVRLFFLVF